MDQEKIAKFIKDIRKKHHLTQKQLADKYHVTYQAVSKWENALNMPDTSLLKQMSNDFGVSLDELLNGEYQKKKKRKLYIILLVIFVIFILTLSIFLIKHSHKNNNFQFKTLSTACKNFNISGNISYNENKSAIYITNIQYCGGEDNKKYKELECILYESTEQLDKKISSFKSKKENISLEEFLKDVTLSVEHYEKSCKEYQENSLYLSIHATDYDNQIIIYKIPLEFNSCSK